MKRATATMILLVLAIPMLFVSSVSSPPPVGFSVNGILVEQWHYDMQSLYSTILFGSSSCIADLGVNNVGGEPDSDLEIIIGSDECMNNYPELGYTANGIWRVVDSQGILEWAKDTETDESRSSPTVADLDGDGDLEIAGGTTSGWNVEVMNHIGGWVWTFPWPPAQNGPFMWHSSPAIADIDSTIDGLEVVIANRQLSSVWCFDGDNSDNIDEGITVTPAMWGYGVPPGTEGTDWDVLWVFPTGTPQGSWPGDVSTPALGDVDNDGVIEVVIGSADNNVYVLNGITGALEWSCMTGGPVYASAAIANLDSDPYLEIVIGSTDGNMYCLEWNGTSGSIVTLPAYAPTPSAIYSSAAIGDIDGDGLLDIVCANVAGEIFAYHGHTTLFMKWAWTVPISTSIYSSPALADRSSVTPYDRDWPMFRHDPMRTGFYGPSPGPQGLDIYIGADDHYLWLIEGGGGGGAGGSGIDKFLTYGRLYTSPSVADIDGDSMLEVVFYDAEPGHNGCYTYWCIEDKIRTLDKKLYVELLKNGDFSNGLTHWMVQVEKGASVQTYDGPTWLATRPLGPGWTDVNLVNEVSRTNVLDIVQTVSDGDGDWTGPYQILNRDVSGFSELYFEADGKAMFQSLAGDGWVGGEYPVHFIIQYEDVNGIQHDTWLGWPANPAWQQGFYYLAGNQPDEPYSNQVTQNVWFHYKSPNLMNLSPAPKMIKTVRLYSSGWAYHGRIDNAQLYGTPPSANLGDVIHVKLEVTVPSGETATVVDTLPSGLSYLTGTFTVDDVPATPTITKIGPPPSPPYHEISYTITESGTHLIEFDCKVDEAKSWTATEACNVATAKWYDEEGNVVETKEDIECFVIHAFEELHKNVGIPKADVVFSFDLTSSMSPHIAAAKSQATTIINDLQTLIADVGFGVVTHVDYPYFYSDYCGYSDQYGELDTDVPPDGIGDQYGIGDYAYKTDLDITTSSASAISTIAGLGIYWGADGPQDYSRVLYETQFLSWRPNAKKIVVLFGDNIPHDCDFWTYSTGGDPGRDAIANTADDLDFQTVVASLVSQGITVLAVDCSSGSWAATFYQYLADETGGQYFMLGETGIPEAIKEIVKAEALETLTIKEKTNVQWAVVMDVVNPFSYTMTNVVITDRFGAEIEIDEPFPYSITHGTVTARAHGGSDKWFLTWNIGNLLPGETARLILLVSTDYNPGKGDCNEDNMVDILDAAYVSAHWTGLPAGPLGYHLNADLNYDGNVDIFDAAVLSSVWGQSTTGHQEYTEPGIYELNSGATLKFIDPEQDMQLSAYTDSIYVTVLPLEDP